MSCGCGAKVFSVGSFNIADGSSCSVPLCISDIQLIMAEFKATGLDGTAKFCLEMSNDGVNFYPANCKAEFDITESTMVRVGLADAYHYRVCYKAEDSTATTGTVDVSFALKLNR